ncbi:hypothetical protein ES703_53678 [subsurface metagenome]
MPSGKWFPLVLTQGDITGGFVETLTTDVPCHLWLYWTDHEPWVHPKSTVDRGLAVPWHSYWCYVAWHKIEQNEAGDTTVHTFTWTGWQNCQTKWFRFHGEIAGFESPSDTAIFHKHYTAPPLGPPITVTFYPDKHPEVTSVDGFVGRVIVPAGDTWTNIHDGAGNWVYDAHTSLKAEIGSSLSQDMWQDIDKAIFLFDIHTIPSGASLNNAKVNLYVKGISNDLTGSSPAYAIYSSAPLSNTALAAADYHSLGTTPYSAILTEAEINGGQRNDFPLNAAGLAALAAAIAGTGIAKLGMREVNYDVANIPPPWKSKCFLRCDAWSADYGLFYAPQLVITYRV